MPSFGGNFHKDPKLFSTFMSEQILSGRYKITKQLGEGGFGQTFLAEDLHLPTKPLCVVKRLKSHFSDEESFNLAHRLFEQEAEVLYRLGNHPNIPNLLAHFEDNGEFVLVQEYIEGATLAQEFESGKKYTEVEAVQFLGELLETLSYVHRQNVIHRDIKPSNLIHRATDGKLFLIDFGAVKQVSVNPFNQNPTFKSTIAIGTNGYAPGEQTIGKPRFASDIYSAGLVSIQALTGFSPLKLNQNEVTGEFVWQHKVRLHPEVINFISKITRYDFRQRYNSATESYFALTLIATNCGIRLKTSQSPHQVINSTPVNSQKFSPPNNQFQIPAGQNSSQFIPPTIIQPQSRIQKSNLNLPPTRQSFHPSSQIKTQPDIQFPARQNQDNSESPKSFGGILSNNDIAFTAFITVVVFGLFFIGGFVLIYNSASNGSDEIAENPIQNNASQIPSVDIIEEADKIASEAAEKQKRAKTKADWEQIGNAYKRANQLLGVIEPNNPNYEKARISMSEYQVNADNADKMANLIIDNKQVPSSNPITTTTSPINNPAPYPLTPYSTPLPAKPPIASMPPPRKDKMYISFNRSPYDARGSVISKVVTSTEGDFTASIGNSGAYSGSVTIRVNGGPDSCDVTFIAPHSERLQPGTYSGAQRYPFQSPTKPGLDFSGTGGCNTVAGSFTINDIIYGSDGKSILLLYATFVHRCGEVSPPTMGRVHYDARY